MYLEFHFFVVYLTVQWRGGVEGTLIVMPVLFRFKLQWQVFSMLDSGI